MQLPAEKMLAEAVGYHKIGEYAKCVPLYNQLLNMEPFNAGVLYLIGDAAVRQGCSGLAINLLSNAVSINPTPEAFTALGCAFKAEGFIEEARGAWQEGLKIGPSAELFNNMAATYADSCQPETAMGFINRALSYNADNPNAIWNRALAGLTVRDWPQAWKDHESRFHPQVQTVSTRRDYGCPMWDGTPGKRLAVHGEQGVGDEIMFLSMLPEVLARCPDTVVEVDARQMDTVERTFGVVTYGNEQAMKAHEKPFDACIPLGSLGMLLRQTDADFPGTPYLKANPERVAYWRRQYAMQGPGPYIGVAWQGGTKSTRLAQRTVRASDLLFAKKGTAISLQYGEGAQVDARKNGYLFWPESMGMDMDEVFAMTAACDLVVTVAQTLVHVAGSMGIPTYVLTPLHASWRYGMQDTMPWYGSVKLLRQKKPDDWGHPLAEAKRVVDKLCKGYKA